ncbi:MAG: UDP-N-acetylglucosamine 1-carboxyvinyltransferase [Syntrophomonadaceae bacterium]|nr:UDP-N-acetylglucosamine 1-carboxyvinyltransferase [Syntrophomonadaceae bacterium]
MDKIRIVGGNRLEGEVKVSGAKNASLPILAACLLTRGECVLHGIPCLRDVEVMLQVLRSLGARVTWQGSDLVVSAQEVVATEIPESLMRQMRASNLVMGALLGRCGTFKAFTPGGCAIGSRPMDLHLKGFNALGAKINQEYGFIIGEAQRVRGVSIQLDFPSVGATENLMMAATLAEGVTVIRNAAREPEIVDLQNFLRRLGARIWGAGTHEIRIEGVANLGSGEHTVIPDRIETGTFLVAGVLTQGDVLISNAVEEHVESILAKLQEAGAEVSSGKEGVRVRGGCCLKAVDVKTLPYPGFPTDMQPQIVTLLSVANGTSLVTETIFENRFKHIDELRRMGARVRLEGRSVIIYGVPRLTGAIVEASDLRAGAALVLAGLVADGETLVEGTVHIDRGYERLEEKFKQLGADIQRLTK